MAKVLHIVGALVIWLILCGIFLFLRWDWLVHLPLSFVFVIYVAMILRSAKTNPVPFSRAANDNLDAYLVYCSIIGKRPSAKEEDDAWIPKLPYSVAVMAAFRRLIDAMRRYSMRDGNWGGLRSWWTRRNALSKPVRLALRWSPNKSLTI